MLDNRGVFEKTCNEDLPSSLIRGHAVRFDEADILRHLSYLEIKGYIQLAENPFETEEVVCGVIFQWLPNVSHTTPLPDDYFDVTDP
ncbi:MAG: hypothetical protein AAFX93_18400 [Verrucomicrobiota bacterium]